MTRDPMENDSMTATKANRGQGAPPGNRNAVKHRLYVYKAMLDGDGLGQRTSLFKA
jgi:hypothetical protein